MYRGWQMSSRRDSRATLFKLVYQMEAVGDFSDGARDAFLEEHLSFEGHKEPDIKYFNYIFDVLVKNIGEIDKQITMHLKKGWTIKRLRRIDLAILRLAIAEMLYSKKPFLIPHRVVINEAVEIAKAYSDEISKNFINGILGVIWEEQNG
jgi:N utilization substance protein B